MDRNAILARTRLADDQSHVNHLRVPRIGIVKLSVSVGGKASKFHLPDDAPPPAQPDQGTDDFHFVPQKETAKISYEIDDRFAIVDTAKLEIFGRFNQDALWTLDLKDLGEDWYAHGKHEVTWDGRIAVPAEQKADRSKDPLEHDLTSLTIDTAKPAFPDGYLTLEHTPYKVRLTLASQEIENLSVTAWTYVQILIKSIEIEIAPEECVPATVVGDDRHEKEKFIRRTVRVPPAGETTKVFLISNLFKKSSEEMGNNTGFSQYQALWGDGPNIPLLAKIRLADSTGAEVKLEEGQGAVALGKVKFLWDWKDPDEVATNGGKPKDFIDAAIDCYKQTTEPKGDNCHLDRGGKRGPNAEAVFPACAGYEPKDPLDTGQFPFKVEACATRTWAAYSYGWTKGKLIGQTGVLFQPSRMAGDDYVITVYLAYDKTGANAFALDKKDQPLAAANALKTATGKFQIWREIHVARYIRKSDTIANFLANLNAAQAGYQKSYIKIKDVRGNDDTYKMSEHKQTNGQLADYNRICKEALDATHNDLFTRLFLAVDPNAAHASDAAVFVFRPHAKFVWNLHESLNFGFKAVNDFKAAGTNAGTNAFAVTQALGMQDDLTVWAGGDLLNRLTRTRNWLRTNGMETDIKYSNYLDDHAPFREVVNGLQTLTGGRNGAAKDGITIVQFDYVHNVERDLADGGFGVSVTNGSAMDSSDGTRSVLFLFRPLVPTFVHEIGHHLFLPHAKGGNPPATGIKEDLHDDQDDNCFMSYNSPREAFCGLCQLRLRGWDATQLNKIGANNKKA